jgi:hypothetical protein
MRHQVLEPRAQDVMRVREATFALERAGGVDAQIHVIGLLIEPAEEIVGRRRHDRRE